MMVLPLKCTCIPYLPHICLILLAAPFEYGMTICPTVALFCAGLVMGLLSWLFVEVEVLLFILAGLVLDVLLLLFSSQLLFNTLFCTLLMAQWG